MSQMMFGVAFESLPFRGGPARRHAEAFGWTLLPALTFTFAGLPFLAVFTNPKHRAAPDLLTGLTMIRLV